MQFLTLSRRRTDAFPPESFTPELLAHEAGMLEVLALVPLKPYPGFRPPK
jgi:hypothetical protein